MTQTEVSYGEGILLMGVEDGLVERCQVYDNGSPVDSSGNRLVPDGGIGIWCHHCDHVLFQYNEAHDDHSQPDYDGGGFAFGRWTTNSIMQYNYAHDNDGYGYMLEGNSVTQLMPENNVIRFNVSENDCRQSRYGALLFEDWEASDVYVYNNTFYMSDNGLRAGDDETYYVAPAIGFDCDNLDPPAAPIIYIYNNIFFTSSSTADISVPVVNVESAFPVSGLTFRGNDYFSNGPAAFQIRWAGGTYLTLNEWGQDSESTSADPALGLESLTAAGLPPLAHTVLNIDNMTKELSVYFRPTSATPDTIRTGGVDLAAAIGPNWWLPDGFNWGGACVQAADLINSDPSGQFTMGTYP
jgi:hypothetical protein